MMKPAKKILLPHIEITVVSTSKAPDASGVILPSQTGDDAELMYFISPKRMGKSGERVDGEPVWAKQQYNHFPVALDSHGVPWAEAEVYILSKLDGLAGPSMATYIAIANDLSEYRRFLDETGLDWLHFPSQKFARPTYRFNGHLKYAVQAGKIAATYAQRQMGTVIGLYRWLIDEEVFEPQNPPWKESDRYINFKDSRGFAQSKKVVTTDVSIKVAKQHDPYDGYIDDGGKLRPLTYEEQGWVMDALVTLGNTEMTLIHLLGMLTGARIQTALTFKVSHTKLPLSSDVFGEIRIPIGPGTRIDSKNNKKMTLHIPAWFYEMLKLYANSTHAIKRREKAKGGDTDDQYLFLSIRGAPLYEDKADSMEFDENNDTRYARTGQGVRQFITERVLPFILQKYGAMKFKYRFHDTRATAGMNWTDHQLKLVELKKTTLFSAREFIKTRMGHESSMTTDRYLQFRENLKFVQWAGQEYDNHLKRLASLIMKDVR